MKKNRSLIVMGFIGLIIVLLFIALAYVQKTKEEKLLEGMPEFSQDYELPEDIEGLNLENQPVITHNEDAEIDIVVFSDYKCVYCKSWSEEILPKVYEELIEPGYASLYYMDFPLFEIFGPDSILAAVAGQAIYEQNNEAYWDFQSLIFKNQGLSSETWANKSFIIELVEDNLSDVVDVEQFKKDLNNPLVIEEVQKDFELGIKYGVTGTPTVFVNEEKIENNSFESIMEKIEEVMTQQDLVN